MRQGRHEALTLAALGITAAAVLATVWLRRPRPQPIFDYSDRSGFPKSPEEMRGIARNGKFG
jgi:hypothetical protein